MFLKRHLDPSEAPRFEVPLWTIPHPLHVVIEEKFIRMRTQPQRIVFFAFMTDPHVDEIRRKDIAFQQKRVIFFQMIQRFTKAARTFGTFFNSSGGNS